MMIRKHKLAAISLVLTLAIAMAGCPGSLVHKVTAAQHNFRIVVGGFQDAEIAEHDKGFVPDDLHAQIQQGIVKVANGGVELDTALAAGANAATLKQKLDAINTVLSSLNANLLSIKNPTSKASLEIALSAVQTVITSAEVLVTP